MSNRGCSLVSNAKGDYQCGRGILQLSYRQGMFLGLREYNQTLPIKVKSKKDNSARQPSSSKLLRMLWDPPQKTSLNLKPSSKTNQCEGISRNRQSQSAELFLSQGDGGYEASPNRRLEVKKRQWASVARLTLRRKCLVIWARLAKIIWQTSMVWTLRSTICVFGNAQFISRRSNQEGQWVLEQTAKSIARSLVLPCKVALQGTDEARELVGGEEGENLPNPVACLVFDWKIRN